MSEPQAIDNANHAPIAIAMSVGPLGVAAGPYDIDRTPVSHWVLLRQVVE